MRLDTLEYSRKQTGLWKQDGEAKFSLIYFQD